MRRWGALQPVVLSQAGGDFGFGFGMEITRQGFESTRKVQAQLCGLLYGIRLGFLWYDASISFERLRILDF
jgi:hypothetical protein